MIQLLVYLVSFQIGYIVAQDADIYSFNRVSIPLSIGNNFSLLSKTVLFTNYTSYDSPKLVFIQQSFQRDIIELDKFTLRIQFYIENLIFQKLVVKVNTGLYKS